VHQALASSVTTRGFAMERAVPDHRARPVIEVEHRRERKVDAACDEVGGEHEAGRRRGTRRVE